MLPAQKRSLLSQSRSVELLLPETLMWRGIYQQSGRRRGLGGCDTSPPRLCCKNFEEKAGSERKTRNRSVISFRVLPSSVVYYNGVMRGILGVISNGEQINRKNSSQNILGGTMSMLPFASSTDGQGINEPLLREYAFFLANKAEGTIEAYLRTARQVMI